MKIHNGDCRDVLKMLEADSLHACVTDPPYELGFMGKAWDATGVANDKPNCIINCDKQRHGEWDGHISLWFDPMSLQFRGDAMPNRRAYIKPARAAA